MIYALDTNILTYLLKGNQSVIRNADSVTNDGNLLILPPIVDYELLRGLLARRMEKKLRQYLVFRQTVTVRAFDEDVWTKAAHIYAALRRRGKPVGDADILIAAFCIVNQCVLVTNNENHFAGIDGLDVTNWVQP